MIFAKDELKPVLRSSNLIRKGPFDEVYKGVVDNAQVAIRKLYNGNAIMDDQFANEIIIWSQVNHKNIVRLIGCCLEMDTLILVYEFVPRGSLHDILYSNNKVSLSLDVRLTIAAESAQGLAYLHSQAFNQILHGRVKPASILLD
uniref:Protein kinase domain-containing protein n=1 Tax=Triticum urartu TaxID=4572 RepID=A0A8R7UCC7_TRIUA